VFQLSQVEVRVPAQPGGSKCSSLARWKYVFPFRSVARASAPSVRRQRILSTLPAWTATCPKNSQSEIRVQILLLAKSMTSSSVRTRYPWM